MQIRLSKMILNKAQNSVQNIQFKLELQQRTLMKKKKPKFPLSASQ